MKLEELKVGDFVRVKTFKYRPVIRIQMEN